MRHAVTTGANICLSDRTRTSAASAPTRSITKSQLLHPPLAAFIPLVLRAYDPLGQRATDRSLRTGYLSRWGIPSATDVSQKCRSGPYWQPHQSHSSRCRGARGRPAEALHRVRPQLRHLAAPRMHVVATGNYADGRLKRSACRVGPVTRMMSPACSTVSAAAACHAPPWCLMALTVTPCLRRILLSPSRIPA